MVDCPHRERLGYGDGQLGIESLAMSIECAGFLCKWAEDWLDGQNDNGDMPHTAPDQAVAAARPGAVQAACCHQSSIFIMATSGSLERAYEPMRRYVEFLESRCTNGILRAYGGEWDFIGDWVAAGTRNGYQQLARKTGRRNCSTTATAFT